jgi:uncharacterized protein YgbK (DUF1537 family)
VLHESKTRFENDSQRIRNSREIMTQMPGLTAATQVEDYVLLTTALFGGGGSYGKLQTAWRDLLGQRTLVLIPATNVMFSNLDVPHLT